MGISRLDQRGYTELVENAPRGPITLILLVDTHEEEKARHLKKIFCQVVHKYNSSRMPLILYYLCYQTYGTWLPQVLKHCDDMETKDVTAHVNACHSGKTVMILALFIARKQLCIFPEQVDSDSLEELLYERREVHSVGKVLGNTLGFDTEVKDHSDTEVKDHSDVEVKDHSDTEVKDHNDVEVKDHSDVEVKDHSDVEVKDHNDVEVKDHNDVEVKDHSDVEVKDHSDVEVKDHNDVEVKDHSDVEVKDHNDVEDSGTPNGDVCSDRNSSIGMNHHCKGTVTTLQFSQKLALWMEKLADGTLKRYQVRTWPNWLE